MKCWSNCTTSCMSCDYPDASASPSTDAPENNPPILKPCGPASDRRCCARPDAANPDGDGGPTSSASSASSAPSAPSFDDEGGCDGAGDTDTDTSVEVERLRTQNAALRAALHYEKTKWTDKIDTFVETWYETNKETVDIGVINFKFFKVDVFPDFIEKHIYKKILKILFSFVKNILWVDDATLF